MTVPAPLGAFTCCECGRDMVALCGPVPDDPALCNACLAIPRWFRDPALRAEIDPTHDGRGPAEAR